MTKVRGVSAAQIYLARNVLRLLVFCSPAIQTSDIDHVVGRLFVNIRKLASGNTLGWPNKEVAAFVFPTNET